MNGGDDLDFKGKTNLPLVFATVAVIAVLSISAFMLVPQFVEDDSVDTEPSGEEDKYSHDEPIEVLVEDTNTSEPILDSGDSVEIVDSDGRTVSTLDNWDGDSLATKTTRDFSSGESYDVIIKRGDAQFHDSFSLPTYDREDIGEHKVEFSIPDAMDVDVVLQDQEWGVFEDGDTIYLEDEDYDNTVEFTAQVANDEDDSGYMSSKHPITDEWYRPAVLVELGDDSGSNVSDEDISVDISGFSTADDYEYVKDLSDDEIKRTLDAEGSVEEDGTTTFEMTVDELDSLGTDDAITVDVVVAINTSADRYVEEGDWDGGMALKTITVTIDEGATT